MSKHETPDPAPEVDFNSYGLHVGQAIAFRPRVAWYRRVWRWIARTILRRKPPVEGFAFVTKITANTITLDRPIAGNELFMSTFHKNEGK